MANSFFSPVRSRESSGNSFYSPVQGSSGNTPAFNATLYGTPLFWFDPDLSTSYTLDGSSRLTQWNDRSATAANLTQPTAGNRLYRTTRNGFGCFQGVAADSTFMNTAANAFGGLISNFTIFLVVSGMNDQPGKGIFNFVNNVASSNDFDSQRLDCESENGGLLVFSAQGDFLTGHAALTNSAWSIVTMQANQGTTTFTIQTDKGSVTSDTYSGLDIAITKLGLGTRYLNGTWTTTDNSSFYIRDFVCYASVLSAANIAAVQTVLAARVGRVL